VPLKSYSEIRVFSIILMSIFSTLLLASEENGVKYTNSFDNEKPGQLPEGWVVDATVSRGWFSSKNKIEKLASWSVQKNTDNQASNKMLAITNINHSSSSTFNLIHTDNFKFKNGSVSVKVRANSGEIDQGGGPMWRVKDNKNYYVARYNPLERNFRVYFVKDGTRVKLKSARNLNIKQNEWFEIKIVHNNDHIEAWVNGKKLLDVRDNTLNNSGGVGLWTKADAVTSFDDFHSSAN